MAIAATVQRYLNRRGIPYDILFHPQTQSSTQTLRVVNIPPDRMAKAVVLGDNEGYLMVLVPASHYVKLKTLRELLHRKVGLASEEELLKIFSDCCVDAIPAVGLAYGLETFIDYRLAQQPEVYFEAGDHEELVHLRMDQFVDLIRPSQKGYYSSET